MIIERLLIVDKVFRFPVMIYFLLSFIIQVGYPQTLDIKTKLYTIDEGLPDNSINAIQKDQDGYLWIATNNGIARFDGKNFVTFSQNTHDSFFKDNIVNDLLVDQNDIYLVSRKEGVKILDSNTLLLSDYISDGVRYFYIKDDLHVILNHQDEIFIYQNRKKVTNKYLSSYKLHKAIIHDNHLYVLTTKKGVIKLDPKTLDIIEVIPTVPIVIEGHFFESKNYGLVYASGKEIYVLNKDRFIPHPIVQVKNNITNYFETLDHCPVHIYNSKNLFEFENGIFINQRIENVENVDIKKVFFSDARSYFLATNQGLIGVTKSNHYVSHINDNPLVADDFIRIRRKIIPIDEDSFYLFGHPGLIVSQKGVLNAIPSPVYSIYDAVLIDDKIYCTADLHKLLVFDIYSMSFEEVSLGPVPEQDFFYSIEKLDNHQIVMGGIEKLVFYQTGTRETKIIPAPDLIIHAILIDGSTLWLATNKGLRKARYDAGIFRWETIPSFYNKPIRDIALDRSLNKIWLGTESDGLLIVNPDDFSFEQKKDEILKNIASITADQDGNMWVSTFNGIVVFDLKENNQYYLIRKNGLLNMEFNYKSAALLENGKMIFGGLNGYDCIDFKGLKKNINANKKIQITGLLITKSDNSQRDLFKNYFNEKKISFNTGKEDLNLLLSDLDLSNSSNDYFTYQINDSRTSHVSNNIIRISNLPYGRHQLSIFLYDEFGNLSDQKQLLITAQVPFYYRNSFYIVLAILILFFGIGISHYIRKARNTEAKVKEQIAMDLHDEVGTVLTRMLLTENSNKETDSQLNILKSGISEALFSIRTSIASLAKNKNSLENLIIDFKEFVSKELSNSTIEGKVMHPREIPDVFLKPELYRDCKLILFEALTNTIKYADANFFYIDISIDSKLRITFTDDGKLKNIQSIYNKGNGIGNIIKRTERNMGLYKFRVAEPSGLKIELIFDLK